MRLQVVVIVNLKCQASRPRSFMQNACVPTRRNEQPKLQSITGDGDSWGRRTRPAGSFQPHSSLPRHTDPMRNVSYIRVRPSIASTVNAASGRCSLPGSESRKQALFVFHNILAGIHSLSTGKSTFTFEGDAHFDIVGKARSPSNISQFREI